MKHWRDLTLREWIIPPPDGEMVWHPIWDTLRMALCVVLFAALCLDFYQHFGWEALLFIVVIVGGMAS